MALITVNRVRIRQVRIIPEFAFVVWMIVRQARRAKGCLGVRIFRTRGLAVWTVTAWLDESAMLAFRDSGAHGNSKTKKKLWFDEASIAHWHQGTSTLPTKLEAAARLRELGRLSHVEFPSAAQARGEIVTT